MNLFKILTDAFRVLFFFIDSVVYGLIPGLYKLIVSLANVDLYNNNSVIGDLLNRVYIIVGIFMLFKLAFSILRYIVDPNSFSDQAKGFTGLVKRVVIALLLLVSVPFIFQKIYDYQAVILNSHIISNLILGTEENMGDMETSAVDLQFIMFGPFYSIDYTRGELSACTPDDKYSLANIIGTTHMATKGQGTENDCLEKFSKMMAADSGIRTQGTSLSHFFKMDGSDERDFNRLGNLVNWWVEDDYAIKYTPIISTICGGYLVFLLLSFCIDVAARAIKLLFLQLLSPVAIITSVDPTSSSQNDKLKDWGSECLKTYLSVFLRLAVIYVVIQLVRIITSKLFSGDIYNEAFTPDPDPLLNIFVYIFLILGAFSVAKKIPELLEKAFGIKMSGELSMNPLKNFTENPGFGLLAGAATGAIAGGLTGGVSAFATSMNQEKGIGRSLLSGAGGTLSGGTTGSFRGAKAKGLKGWDAGMQSGGRIARRMEVRNATGGVTKIPAMTMDRLRDKMGAPTSYESKESRASRYDDVGKKIEDIRSRATDQLSKKSNEWKVVQAERTRDEELLRNGGLTQDKYVENINSYYQREQDLIAEYVDNGGLVTKDSRGAVTGVTKDGQLSLHKQALAKAVKDTKDEKVVSKLDSSGKIEVDKTGKPVKQIDVEKASWKELGGDGALLKGNAEQIALGIRSEPSYNDSFDRHQAIHGARTDAHMKH